MSLLFPRLVPNICLLRTAAPSTSRHEDIYGAVNGAGRPASITLTSPGQYGGMVRIQEMLARAEEGSQEPPPHTLQRPRIYGDGVPDE